MKEKQNQQEESSESQIPAGSQVQEKKPLAVPEESKKEYAIDIFRDWCKQCGICAAFCPRDCIKQDESGTPIVERSERCSGCGWCELHCPDFAISVRRKTHKVQEEE